IIDSEDLPLNVSREVLQNNPMVASIKSAITRRVVGELQKKADNSADEYAAFWDGFGAVLKEGLYEDPENRDDLLKLARFHSTTTDGLVSLADYTGRMQEGQNAVYYITGDDLDTLRRSPQLEGFAARNVEVLLLTDSVDEFWLPAVGEFDGKPFKSATRAGADLGDIKAAAKDGEDETKSDESAEDNPPGVDTLVSMFKLELGDEVKDVRISERLTDSAVCLVSDEGDMDIHLERMLKQHKQLESTVKRVLEVNPTHPLITALGAAVGNDGAGERVTEAAWLLLDQARIIEGETLPDPAAFSRRMAQMMEKGLV
ncbi:MAG: molecular chaperone HtpG, partial [Alphaproteobacteria bacterium]